MSERKDRDEERKKRMKGKETRGRGWVGERNREGKAGRKKKEARIQIDEHRQTGRQTGRQRDGQIVDCTSL